MNDRPAADAGTADAPLEEPIEGPVIVFDGVCNLCTGTVRFVIPRDDAARFAFAPLQSDVGARLYERCGEDPDRPETFVVIEGEECYRKADAAIRIAEGLGGVYRLASLARIVPRPIRNAVYDLVARHRYRVFGKKDACMRPTPDIEDRFLAMSPVDEGGD